MVAWHTDNGDVAVLGGVRTPFTRAGTALSQVDLTDLARTVMQETLYRTGLPPARVDHVILGNVGIPADAANPARVAAMQAGVPARVPAFTVHRNCASGIEAVAQGASHIYHGQADFVLAAGAESMSTIPLLLPRETIEPMGRLYKARTLGQRIAAVAALRPRQFFPQSAIVQGLTDPLCGMIMGKTAELLACEFGITRREQDTFALQSHQLATQAINEGRFDNQITTFYAGERFGPVVGDIGPRQNQTMRALERLRPIFDRRDGTVTVGNACQVTDGAAALLVANAELARAEGFKVLGHIRAAATAALDPAHMGLGPVFAIDELLRATGLDLSDIDLFEINEAFAAQVLACLKAMGSESFCCEQLGRSGPLGEIAPDRLNVNGGAVAVGHPVGATGTRIVLNLLLEMNRRDVALGIASLCVAGGQGAAILMERI